MILGSATPSLETYARAEKGVYHLLSLPERVNNQPLPAINIVDMREELANGNRSMFSTSLREAIEERLARNEQIVLFLNQRGYSSFVLCRDCGHVPQCPNCDISLTYHKSSDQLNVTIADTKKHRQTNVRTAKVCTFAKWHRYPKVEELLNREFEEAKIIRMDADTTSRKARMKIIERLRRRKGDILLGTQMIAKD